MWLKLCHIVVWRWTEGGALTDLLVVLLGFETDDLQDAGAGDVGHHVRHALPHAQQGAAQHVVLAESHALQTLLALLDFLTLPSPEETTASGDYSQRWDKSPMFAARYFMAGSQVMCKCLRTSCGPDGAVDEARSSPLDAIPATVTRAAVMVSCLPVGMAAFLEGEGELVLPAVSGLLWSHLHSRGGWRHQ